MQKIRYLLTLMLCIPLLVNAKDVYEAHNGDTINATISLNNLTRIEILNQKIVKDYSSANVSKSITKPFGQVYLVPNTQSSFNLYVVSDTGNTYNLRLTPSTIATGDSIVIKPIDSVKKQNNKSKILVQSDYIREINYLLQIMYLDKQDDSIFNVQQLNQPISTYKDLDSVILSEYDNTNIKGSILLVKNTSKSKMLLKEAQFYLPHTLAIAIENPELNVNDFTRIFIIQKD